MILQGYPTEISEEIVLPDLAELLQMPTFFDNSPEDVYKYGTDFQKMLMDKTPLRNTKKTISVLSEVRLLYPNFRSCTGVRSTVQGAGDEWHIDCEENENEGKLHIFDEPRDIVHLLSNEVSCLTEFNLHEQEIDWKAEPTTANLSAFIDHLFANNLVEAKAMPANRIVTFTNHLHRAVDPKRIEFRYMWRVVETDRERPAAPYQPDYVTTVTGLNGTVPHLKRDSEKVTIYLPTKNNDKARPERKVRSYQEKLDDFVNYNNPSKFNSIKLSNCSWEGKDISHLPFEFSKDSLVIYSKTMLPGNEGRDAFKHYIEGLEIGTRLIKIIDETNYGNSFNLYLKDPFLLDDPEDAELKYIGFAIEFGNEAEHLVPNHKYSIRNIEGLFGLDTSDIIFIAEEN